jgi:hypothetical protein
MIGVIADLIDGYFQPVYRERGLLAALYASRVRTLAPLALDIIIDWDTFAVTGTTIGNLPFVMTPVWPKHPFVTAFELSIAGGEPTVVPDLRTDRRVTMHWMHM